MNIRQHVKELRLEAASLADKLLVTFESIEVVRPIENLRLGGPSSFTLIWGGKEVKTGTSMKK